MAQYIASVAIWGLIWYGQRIIVHTGPDIIHEKIVPHISQLYPEYPGGTGYDSSRVSVGTITVLAFCHGVVLILKLVSDLDAAVWVLVSHLTCFIARAEREQCSDEYEEYFF